MKIQSHLIPKTKLKAVQIKIILTCFVAILFVVLPAGKSFAQQGGVVISANPADEPDASAILDVKSSDKGALFPRMTEGQRLALSAPATGLLIYQTDGNDGFYYFDGSGWMSLSADKTPPGSVMSYTGTTAPAGWLLCDGSVVARSVYADLFAIIGTAYGSGDGSTTFHLPDMRGMFMRGVDAGVGNDPDVATRLAANTGGNTGDNIGSVQEDALQGHRHDLLYPMRVTPTATNTVTHTGWAYDYGANFSSLIGDLITDGTNGTPRTTTESRPKNLNFNFIIKY